MTRTQIYLKQAESDALDREARRTGRTRSQLIREAVAAAYLGERRTGDLETVLLETAGAWKRRTTGRKYVEGLRRGRRIAAAVVRRG